jgi:hypothetical protein
MTDKKVNKKKVKENAHKKKVLESERGDCVPEAVIEKESRTLIWFFIIVGLVFASILVPYFASEGAKSFEYADISWQVEEYAEPTGMIYHGRFLSFVNPSLYYNIYLRLDPRENNVETVGTFNEFKYGGYVAWDEDVDVCRGELSRAMLDLAAFLKTGVGVGVINSSASSKALANSSGMDFVSCDVEDRTVVIVDIGEVSRVVQDEDNPNCYTIYATDCDDLSSIEKFIVKSTEDWNNQD